MQHLAQHPHYCTTKQPGVPYLVDRAQTSSNYQFK